MFGFEHPSDRHSMSSSYGPGTVDEEMRYMRHADGLKDAHQVQSEEIIASSVAPQMMAVSFSISLNSFVQYLRTIIRLSYFNCMSVSRNVMTAFDQIFVR